MNEDALIKPLSSLLRETCKERPIPLSRDGSLIVLNLKNGTGNDCNDHHGISLDGIVTKALVSIMFRCRMPIHERDVRENRPDLAQAQVALTGFILRQLLFTRHTQTRKGCSSTWDVRCTFKM